MLWTVFALLATYTANCQVLTGTVTGLTLMNGNGPFSLDLTIDVPNNTVTILMCTYNPPDWFGFGFGNTVMLNTYAIISEGGEDGDITERVLANRSPGTLLSSSLYNESSSIFGIQKCILVKRDRDLPDRYSFPSSPSTIDFIFAGGTTENLAYHGQGGCNVSSIRVTNNPEISGSLSNLVLMSGNGLFSVTVTIDVPRSEVTIILCTGNPDYWFGFGFGNTVMNNTYAIISEGDGDIMERILGRPIMSEARGTLLDSSFSSESTLIIGNFKCVTVTRPRVLSDRYSFPSTDSTIPLIYASGLATMRSDLAYHEVDECNVAALSIPDDPNGGGDPEYKFLDGVDFLYNGPCQYILVSNQCDKEKSREDISFNIITRHGRARSRTKDVSIINDIIININDTYTITISKDNTISKNKEIENSDLDISISTIYEINPKNENEERIVITLKNYFKLKVNLDNNGVVWLDVNKKIHTCGILGNNNGVQYDDLVLSNGTVLSEYTEENINLMCDSWQVPYDKEPLQCKLYPETSYTKKFHCKNFEYETISQICEKFAKDNLNLLGGKWIEQCFRNVNETFVDATRVFDDCKTQVCNCEQDTLQDCEPDYAMKELKGVCNQNGIQFNPVWDIQ